MELNNDEQIVNAEQFFFNTVLEQNVNTKYSFDENDTNFNQSIDTNTVSIKEETADSVFVEEDRLLETKIKIEDHDYHNAPCLFDRRFYYNENNSIQNDLDTTSKSVKSAKDFDNFFTDDLKQSIKIDCSSTASADCGGDYTESIDWKPAVENNTDFENFNKSFLMSEVSLNNFNESNPWEIFNEEKCVLERYTEKKANAVELYVYLQQHDLYELQRHFRKNQRYE